MVKAQIIANGGAADIRGGRLGGRIVAVKTFRTSKQTDVTRMHKVRSTRKSSVPLIHQYDIGSRPSARNPYSG